MTSSMYARTKNRSPSLPPVPGGIAQEAGNIVWRSADSTTRTCAAANRPGGVIIAVLDRLCAQAENEWLIFHPHWRWLSTTIVSPRTYANFGRYASSTGTCRNAYFNSTYLGDYDSVNDVSGVTHEQTMQIRHAPDHITQHVTKVARRASDVFVSSFTPENRRSLMIIAFLEFITTPIWGHA